MKNGGWLDVYDDAPQAENGIEGTMGGLTDVGFNYNGAWGGTMAMGGSMPGAVGFTYARTGSIPANGPYAKKTMASAQDGKEVEYMELPEITVVGSKDKQTRDFYNNLIDTLSKGKNSSNAFANENITGKYLGLMSLGKEYGFPKVKPETKLGIYKNARGHYNPLTKTIYTNDPNQWVAEMAHHVQMKDNIVGKGLQWLGNDLVQYLKKPAIELRNAFKYGADSSPVDYTQEDFNEWIDTSPYEKKGTVEYEAHSEIEPMLREKVENARKDYRNSPASKASIKRFLYKNRNLQNGGEMKYYQEGLDWKPRNISRDGSEISQAQFGKMLAPITGDDVAKFFDMFSVPQKAATKAVTGKYQTPSEAMNIKNPVGAFATDMILDPLNLMGAGIVGKAAKASTESGALSKAYKYNPLAFKPNPEANYRMLGSKGYDDALESGVIRPPQTQYPSTNFENAFYNKGYPLDTRFRDLTGRAGYEGPYMAEVKGNKELFVNDNPYGYTGPMFADPVYYSKQNIPIDKEGVKFYKEDWLQGYKKVKPPKKQNGGEIPVDPMGYWNPDNVGEPVIIPSNEITMEGVYQPLLGISDTGDTQMMYPGEDYEFDGETVTEYPIAKSGMNVNNADAQPIEKLDQLLNFTNYNKPTKGGWLDKYN